MTLSRLWQTCRPRWLGVAAAICAAVLMSAVAQPAAAQAGAAQPGDGSDAWTDVAGGLVSAAAQGDDALPTRYRRLSLDMIALQPVLAPALALTMCWLPQRR